MKNANQSAVSKIPTEILKRELQRRNASDPFSTFELELQRIKGLIEKSNIKAACEFDLTAGYKGTPHYILGVIKKGRFCDFYYNSGLEYEEFQKFIPSCFAESMESTYEISGMADVKDKDPHKFAIKTLKKAGYTHFEDVTGQYN